MSTTQVVAAFFQLQQLDLELDRLTVECQSIVNALRGNTRLQRLRSDYTVAQQQLKSGQQAQQDAEWALADVNRRLQTTEQRLYDGKTSNLKELDSLRREEQRLRAQQHRQESQTREVTDAAESLQEMTLQRETALKEAETAWVQETATLNARLAQAESRKQELQAKRAQLAGSIEAPLLTRYETLRRTKQGRAVSKVENNSCQWCRVILTSSELQRVRISSELQTCSNCGRILYYDR